MVGQALQGFATRSENGGQCPAVARDFATRVLKLVPPAGVHSLADHWTEYAARTNLFLIEARR
jgi:hypothetical protein